LKAEGGDNGEGHCPAALPTVVSPSLCIRLSSAVATAGLASTNRWSELPKLRHARGTKTDGAVRNECVGVSRLTVGMSRRAQDSSDATSPPERAHDSQLLQAGRVAQGCGSRACRAHVVEGQCKHAQVEAHLPAQGPQCCGLACSCVSGT